MSRLLRDPSPRAASSHVRTWKQKNTAEYILKAGLDWVLQRVIVF